MTSITKRAKIGGAITLAAVTLAATALVFNAAAADEITVPATFEISEDASRFVFDDAPVFDDGLLPMEIRSSPKATYTNKAPSPLAVESIPTEVRPTQTP